MARRIVWTESALNDVRHVWGYIARDSVYYADVFTKRVRERAASLDQFAFRGRMVPEFGDPSVREVYVKHYRLIYRVTDDAVQILAFIHGARDLPMAWDERDRPEPGN